MAQKVQNARSLPRKWVVALLCLVMIIMVYLAIMWWLKHVQYTAIVSAVGMGMVTATSSDSLAPSCANTSTLDLSWYPPISSSINNLSTVLNGTGVYDYVFNTSKTPSTVPYSTYNWCNMPHVRPQEYQVPPPEYQLAYVEVIHRHHKRTPYQANTFPVEQYPWHCNESTLYYFAKPADSGSAAQIAWSIAQSPLNPFTPTGYQNSSCQFPQITAEGLDDSRQHGADLFAVYHDLLKFLPTTFDPANTLFRVTNNVITSQVASQVAIGMYPSLASNTLPVHVQPSTIDSLEPSYSCPAATTLLSTYATSSNSSAWLAHLTAPQTTALFSRLDAVSHINTSSTAWHAWFDHYFDNLSSKLCHAKPLPCSTSNSTLCTTHPDADAVFRAGLYEYSYIYRDAPASLPMSVASFGVWLAELASHLRAAASSPNPSTVGENPRVKYRHNVAHDGSISRLLSILQVETMVWPGMGSEVVFEVWRHERGGCAKLRVLWKGEVLKSASPMLGTVDMVDVQTFLAYVDGLVGEGAAKVPGLCEGSGGS